MNVTRLFTDYETLQRAQARLARCLDVERECWSEDAAVEEARVEVQDTFVRLVTEVAERLLDEAMAKHRRDWHETGEYY